MKGITLKRITTNVFGAQSRSSEGQGEQHGAPEKAGDYSRDGEISHEIGTPAKFGSCDKGGGQRRGEAERG